MSQDYSYIGVGPIYMRDRNGTGGLIPIGNSSALSFSAEEDEKELMDFTSGGGGTRNEVRRITGVTASITVHDLSPSNVSMALYGTTEAFAAGSVADEAVTAHLGALVTLDKAGATDHVVKSNDDVTTYVLGTDYDVVPAGIIPLVGGAIVAASALKVSYDYPAQDLVQALTKSAGEYELVFDGINEARSGKPYVVTAHRFRPGAAQNLDLIGDDYAGLEIAGKLLADTTKGVGLSKFFTTKIVA